MTKENFVSAKQIVIIALILLVFYLYYQKQTFTKSLSGLKKELATFEPKISELTKQSIDYEKTLARDLNSERQRVSELEKEIKELNLRKAGDWAINRIQELETSLRNKETKIQSLEKALRKAKK